MSKYIKSHSNFILQKKHQKIESGTIYYQDQLTVNGISEFSNVDGQIPIYRDGNFILTTRPSKGYTRSMSPKQYTNNSYSGNVWTSEVLDNYPIDNDSQIDTIDLKFNYYSLRDFSYYGSCTELIRASINDIVSTFPGELYVSEKNGKGVKVAYKESASDVGSKQLGKDGYLYSVSNPFEIDLWTNRSYREIEESNTSNLRFFSNDQYLLYNIITKDGYVLSITGWESNSRYLADGSIFTGDDGEWAQLVLEGKTKQCFLPGDEMARITLNTEDKSYDFRLFKRSSSENVLMTTEDNVGIHIRPNDATVDDWFRNLDKFESMLMQRDSTPIYTAKFEVLKEDPDTGDISSQVQKFTMPLGEGGWNIASYGFAFESYVVSLRNATEKYDELFCDNLYKSMTHESVKNMDWSVYRYYNAENSDEDYTTPQQNMAKMLRVMAREFDEIKFYIDGLGKLNCINYADNEDNMSNYFLSDSLENEGWELVAPYTKTLSEYIEYSGQTLYRDVAISGNNEFLDTFGGIPFSVNEKENYVTVPCTNVTFIRIEGDKYYANPDKTITVNGKTYPQITVSGVPAYNITEDITYTVRYVTVDGVKFYVNEETKTLTINGKVYDISDDQKEVVVTEAKYDTYKKYDIIYDNTHVASDFKLGDSKMTFNLTRTGLTHNNAPVKAGLETEDINAVINNDEPVVPYVQTTGWSNDLKYLNYREYFFDITAPETKVYMPSFDTEPMDDEFDLTLADGNSYHITRADNADEVKVNQNSVRSNTFQYVWDLYHNYSEVNTYYDKSLNINGLSQFKSGDYDTKSVVLDASGSVVFFYKADTGYTITATNSAKINESGKVTNISWYTASGAIPTTEHSSDVWMPYNDWSSIADEYTGLTSKGVKVLSKEAYITHSAHTDTTEFDYTGQFIKESITGDMNKNFISKELLLANTSITYYCTFVFAFSYYTGYGSGSTDRYWTLDGNNEEMFTNPQFVGAKNQIAAIQNSYSTYRTDHKTKYPLIYYPLSVGVKLTTEDINNVFPTETEIPFGDMMNTEIGNFITDSTIGFQKVANVNDFCTLLYNKAVDELIASDATTPIETQIKNYWGLTHTAGSSTYTLNDKYFGKSLTVTTSDAAGLGNLYGFPKTGDNLVGWAGYRFVFGTLTVNPAAYNYAGDEVHDSIGGFIDPYLSEGNYNLFKWGGQPIYPYVMTNSAVTITTSDYSFKDPVCYNTYASQRIVQDSKNIGLVQSESSTHIGFSTSALTIYAKTRSVYDQKLIGINVTDLKCKTYTSSFGSMNIPSSVEDAYKNGFRSMKGNFVKVYAEREVLPCLCYSKSSPFTGATDLYNFTTSNSSLYPVGWHTAEELGYIYPNLQFDVVNMGWFYFNTNNLVTLQDLGLNVLNENDESTREYTVPDSIVKLDYSDELGDYATKDGIVLSNLPEGVYFLNDNGAGLFKSKSQTASTYKDFQLNYLGEEQRKTSEEVKVPLVSEERKKHIDNYFYPITDCEVLDDTKYKLHREFSDDSDYEFTPYDCSLSDTCGGYFYKKCCTKEPAMGRPAKVEKTPYVEYKNKHLWLCPCDCSDDYYRVLVNNVEYTASSSASFITIEDTVCDIKWDRVTYYRISDYQSPKNYESSDVMYRFYKNLRLNSRKLLQKKGTVEGLEGMLALFGLKSKRWFDGLSLMQQKSWGFYDYEINEYTCFTDKIEDIYDRKLSMGKIAYINQLKSISHNNEDSATNNYDGLPVKYISYYKDKFGNVTKDQYSPDYSVNTEYKNDLYPYFDKDSEYDGNTYFQMYGGWLPIYPFRFSKKDDIMLPYMNENGEMKGLHTETLRNIRSFQNLEELLAVTQSSVKANQIAEVSDLSPVYAIVNGCLYEVHTASYILPDSQGIKKERKCSYIEAKVGNRVLQVGNAFYYGDVYVSDPMSYCTDDENEKLPFTRHYDINQEKSGKVIKMFLYKYDEYGEMTTVNVDTDDLKDDEEGLLYCSIILRDNTNGSDFDIFKNNLDVYSSYFKLGNTDYCDELSYYGWYQLKNDDPDVIRIQSIVDNFKGNNPHSDAASLYDNGLEYMERFAQLFKFPLENSTFMTSKFGYNGIGQYGEEEEYIMGVGFDNITTVSGGAAGFSVSGDQINTRDNYNMYRDSKVHFFGNFYTNNQPVGNVLKSDTMDIDKYGLTDEVVMDEAHTMYYGYNPNTNTSSGNVYNLSNVACINTTEDITDFDAYTRANTTEENLEDYHTERIINNKILDINFFTDHTYYSKNYLEKYKYIDDVILFYLQQMIPSTTIARINFGGVMTNYVRGGELFQVNADGTVSVKQPDCGTIVFEQDDSIRVDRMSDVCPPDEPHYVED